MPKTRTSHEQKETHSRRSRQNAPPVSLVRSSAAEYLTFVAANGQGGVEAVYADENVWLTQKMLGLLYDVDVRTISYHLKNLFADHELEESSVIQFFRITAADRKSYDTQHYNLAADLQAEFPDMGGLSARNLLSMKLFAEAFPAGPITKQPVSQLPWGQIIRLLQMVKAPAARETTQRRPVMKSFEEKMPRLVAEPVLVRKDLAPSEVRIYDPACGSGGMFGDIHINSLSLAA